MKFEPWLRRHPLVGYFALTYLISWGGILLVISATGLASVASQPQQTGLIFVSMLLGPSISGLTLTALLDGLPGLKRLGESLLRKPSGGRWYAVALLTAPMLLLAVLWPLSILVDKAFTPRFEWALFAVGLVAGSFEEIGWTGFATPRMLRRQRAWTAGLSLGVIWALWHLLVDFRQNFDAKGFAWVLEFTVLYVVALSAYRVLMTWVYANTASLLLSVLMHASYTGWLFVLFPITSFAQSLRWQSMFALALCVVAATVVGTASWRKHA